MKKKGKKLEFISKIKRDGSGVEPVEKEYIDLIRNDEFVLNRLSITEDTYIASGFNSLVVRLKENKK